MHEGAMAHLARQIYFGIWSFGFLLSFVFWILDYEARNDHHQALRL